MKKKTMVFLNALLRKQGYDLNYAFSLMEMMIVLLIIAIIAAATAPIVSRKMLLNATNGESPWVFTNTNGAIAYNMAGNQNMQAIIGAIGYNANGGPAHPRLVLSSGGTPETPALVFATGNNGTYRGQINMTENTVAMNGGNGAVGTDSVAIGMGQEHTGAQGTVAIGRGAGVEGTDSIAIGHDADAGDEGAISIGQRATATEANSIAIGRQSNASVNSITIGNNTLADSLSVAIGPNANGSSGNSVAIGNASATGGERSVAIGSPDGNSWTRTINGTDSVAIGPVAVANGSNSVAIGRGAWTNSDQNSFANAADNAVALGARATAGGNGSISIGNWSFASGTNSVAIGPNAVANQDNMITLGTADSTVYIPGNLVVNSSAVLGYENNLYNNTSAIVAIREGNSGKNLVGMGHRPVDNDDSWQDLGDMSFTVGPFQVTVYECDKRLKNIGKKYEAGMAELKKLDFYHYTYKADKDKKPHVGVIAQDLQKVFPDAVTSDIYGYLRIRWDEMFYAVINAVKELDTRITALAEQVKSNFDETKELKSTVAEQQKTIEAQQKTIDELLKRVEKLEK